MSSSSSTTRKRKTRSLERGERSRTTTPIICGSGPSFPDTAVVRSWSSVPIASVAEAIFQDTCRLGKIACTQALRSGNCVGPRL